MVDDLHVGGELSPECDFFFFQAEDGIRDATVTGVQTCALPIWRRRLATERPAPPGNACQLQRRCGVVGIMRALKHVLRRLRRAPGFTAVALVTLALGIGATTAIFSVLNGVLIRPLPYPRSQQLVGVWHVAPGIAGLKGDINCSPPMYFTYREESRTFQEFGLWSNDDAS